MCWKPNLNGQDNIQKATVYERTGDVVLTYRGSRKDAAALLAAYRFDNEELEVLVTSHDSRKINQEYQEKMVSLVAGRVFRKVFLPAPIAAAYTVWRSIAFVWKGIRCLLHRKLEVEVLDALSITASLLRGDYSTAGSVMFLLTVGSLLEEWTRKKSLDDLARSMALNVDKVWVRTPQGEVLVPLTRVHAGDEVVVRSGNMIPLDGRVLEGEAMVNQAALTGESMPVRKTTGATVYAEQWWKRASAFLWLRLRAVPTATIRSWHDRGIGKAQVRHRKPGFAAGRPSGAVVPCRYGGYLCLYPQRHPGHLHLDGGLLLCAEAFHAAGSALCHAGVRGISHHRKGRQVSGSAGKGGHHRVR